MKKENICLFNPARSSDLVCRNFVLERGDGAKTSYMADHYILHLVCAGEGTWICQGQTRPLSTGVVFLVSPGETYSIEGNGALEYYYITFSGRRAVEVTERVAPAHADRVAEGFEDLIPFWQNCLMCANADNLDLISEAVLLYTLARLTPRKSVTKNSVAAALQLTDECFTDPDLTLGAVAARLGYDAKYLSFAFHREQGVTWSRYLRDLRVRRAAFLMEQGVESIKNVARLSGFRDPLYFSKVFSKIEGVSPRAYLASLGQKKSEA